MARITSSGGGGNAIVPDDAPIQGPQAFVTAFALTGTSGVFYQMANGGVDWSLPALGQPIYSLDSSSGGMVEWMDNLTYSAGFVFSLNLYNQFLNYTQIDNLLSILALNNHQVALIIDGANMSAPTCVPEIVSFQLPASPVSGDGGNHNYLDIITNGQAPYLYHDAALTLAQSTYTGTSYAIGFADSPTATQRAAKLAEMWNTTFPYQYNPDKGFQGGSAVAVGDTVTLTDYNINLASNYSFNNQDSGIIVNETSAMAQNVAIVTITDNGGGVTHN